MVSYCAAFGCKNTKEKGSDITLHYFPSDNKLRSKWAHATKRKEFKPTKHSVLCSEHFLPKKIYQTLVGNGQTRKQKRLISNAIPSVFHGFRPHLNYQRKNHEGYCKDAKTLSSFLTSKMCPVTGLTEKKFPTAAISLSSLYMTWGIPCGYRLTALSVKMG